MVYWCYVSAGQPVPRSPSLPPIYDSENVTLVEVDTALSTCTGVDGIKQTCTLTGDGQLPSPTWVDSETYCDNVVSKVSPPAQSIF